MRVIAEKLRNLERELKADRGPFAYFALVRDGEAPDRWDLVVSAPWISANPMEGIRLIAEQLKKRLALQELLSISKIVPLEEGNPYLEASRSLFSGVDGDLAEMRGDIVNGILLADSYLITSQFLGVPHATSTTPPTQT